MSEFFKQILGSTIITGFFTAVIAYFFHKRTEKYNSVLKREFEALSKKDTAYFEWRKNTVELLGQVYIHLNRLKLAFQNKYSKVQEYDRFYEDEIILKSNQHIRDLLINNGHALPPELLDEATKLIEHFDVWLTKYNQIRILDKDFNSKQIYVGPDGFRFPENAERLFKEKYVEMFNELHRA
ncbi:MULTISPECIES: hypothetical protein [Chryseobacterium]|uniref:Uncharacterized protein n=1 Tax=Candidatus Chryseobacterium massiliense TaxID=204089 RepID=A0A3D9B504_9FLAO|nr:MULTISPECIES: hypothetical protein [Chryseobacterium]REC48408.1 hypothetical protein DRF68_11950 [Candidatus Chryseobacterium massiliae]